MFTANKSNYTICLLPLQNRPVIKWFLSKQDTLKNVHGIILAINQTAADDPNNEFSLQPQTWNTVLKSLHGFMSKIDCKIL